ncbi:MAG: hypothetical protein H5T63_11860 [Chloroflexi bacterium]|nr:hypothetical protein [Chloroflexota bacterium]
MQNPVAPHQSKLLRSIPWLLAFAVLILAGVVGMAWALPGKAALGQTIPPPPTATPTATRLLLPTPTWTPRPTWTRAPTLPPAQPSPTAQEPGTSPTPTYTEIATVAPTQPTPALGTPTLSPQAPEQTPTTTMPPPPMPLVFEIAVHPQIAGPADDVYFVLQVANVGYEPIDGVSVSLSLPQDLVVRTVNCERCAIKQEETRWHLSIGRLLSGEQVIVPIQARVAEDAWPGQLLQTDWVLTAEGMPPQSAQAAVTLPWAELPGTGEVEQD